MPKCKKCGKWTLFQKLNSDGLCKECEEEIIKSKRLKNIKEKQNLAYKELDNLPSFQITLCNIKRKRRSLSELTNIRFSNITQKGNYDDFVTIDTETTGLSVAKNKIIEIGAIRFHKEKPISQFHTLINPQTPIPPEASQINHIYYADVKNAPAIYQVLPSLENFVKDSNIVGHNLIFDLKFITKAGSNLIDTKRKYYCTLKQSEKILKHPKMKWDKEFENYEPDYTCDYDVEDYKLNTLCSYYNIIIPRQHRATSDAIATGKLFLKLINEKRE